MYINLLFECLFIFIRSFICFNKYQILLKLNTNILKHSVYGDGFCQGWEYDEAVVNLYRVWNMDSRGRTYAILSLAHFRFHDVAATCFGPSVSRHFSESFDHALYTQTSTSIHSLIADRAKLNPWTTAYNLFGRPFGRSLGTTLKIGRKFSDQNFGLNTVYVCLVLKIPSSKIQEKIPVPFSWYSFFLITFFYIWKSIVKESIILSTMRRSHFIFLVRSLWRIIFVSENNKFYRYVEESR